MTTLFDSILAPSQILSSDSDLEYYGHDACKDFAGKPSLVLQPGSVDQIVAIVKICRANSVAIVPSGGRTGYSGGATATCGEVVLSLDRLNRIHEINTLERTMRCDAGVATETVQTRAREAGLFYPCDFASRGSSQIGGNAATNAGGLRVIRYGSTRDWVLGLKVVTGSGELLDLNGPLYKNQTGYDLRSLFIGSEGTLGVIVEVTLKLATVPQEHSLALAASGALRHAMEALEALRSRKFNLNLFEYFDANCLKKVLQHNPLRSPFREQYDSYFVIEAETPDAGERERFEFELAELIEAGVLADVIVAQGSQQETDLLALRESISDTLAKHHVPHKNDLSVPLSKIPLFVDNLRALFEGQYSQCEVLIFGHLGDGNLHVNVLKPAALTVAQFGALCHEADEKVFGLVRDCNGSISAEHGVGLLKKPFLHFSRSASEIRLMREIKRVFDPAGIMNPGKVL